MAERDEDLERRVALAKTVLRAPRDARARVRAKLAAEAQGVSLGRAEGPNGAARVADSVRAALLLNSARSGGQGSPAASAMLWVGVGLCVGYWLGFHHFGASLVPGASSDAKAWSATVADSQGVAGGDGAPGDGAPGDGAPEHPGGGAPGDGASGGGAPGGSGSGVAAPARPGARDDLEGAGLAETERLRSASERRRASVSSRRGVLTTNDANPGTPNDLERRGASSFAAEVALLERAERAIRAGEGTLAVAFLNELERQYPRSTLRAEAAAARVLAVCEVARTGGPADRQAARAGAERFLSRGSAVYADRVRQVCRLSVNNGSSAHEDPSEPGH